MNANTQETHAIVYHPAMQEVGIKDEHFQFLGKSKGLTGTFVIVSFVLYRAYLHTMSFYLAI